MHAISRHKQPATLVAAWLLSALPLASHAQTPPDAGSLLRDTLPDATYQPRSASSQLTFEGAPLTEGDPSERRVRIEAVTFTGNSVYSSDTLYEEVRPLLEEELDMAGLQGISNTVSRFYRDQGYPFAQAMLPRQDLSQGELRLVVVEGQYGEVSVTGQDTTLTEGVAPYLAHLRPGQVIQGAELERTALLISDLPGVNATPVMRPGEASGTGDLVTEVSAGPRATGYVGLDNHGSRSSGEGRASLGVSANRLLTVGDEVTVSGLYSEENLWLGQVAYSVPLGHRGFRGHASYARTEYDLRSPFTGFTGTADTSTLAVSYPLVRQQQSNLTARLGAKYTELNDRFEGVSYQQRYGKHVPASLQFDHRDSLGQGGITYGEVSLQGGEISDQENPVTAGGYTKGRLDVSRLQGLGQGVTLMARGQLQWADSLLDSSERMSLGGARSVRAYPQGELSGSRVWLAQVELRYQATATLAPYVFYDHGQRQAFDEETRETLAGGGVGVRYSNGPWGITGAVATPTTGEAASQDEQRDPRGWVSLRYSF